MKSLNEVLNYYGEYETPYDDRFGRRLCNFLTVEQMGRIGYTCIGELHPREWTEENVLAQLQEDVLEGWRSLRMLQTIKAEALYNTCLSWCSILCNGLDKEPFGTYKRSFFDKVAEKYRWKLEEE